MQRVSALNQFEAVKSLKLLELERNSIVVWDFLVSSVNSHEDLELRQLCRIFLPGCKDCVGSVFAALIVWTKLAFGNACAKRARDNVVSAQRDAKAVHAKLWALEQG